MWMHFHTQPLLSSSPSAHSAWGKTLAITTFASYILFISASVLWNCLIRDNCNSLEYHWATIAKVFIASGKVRFVISTCSIDVECSPCESLTLGFALLEQAWQSSRWHGACAELVALCRASHSRWQAGCAELVVWILCHPIIVMLGNWLLEASVSHVYRVGPAPTCREILLIYACMYTWCSIIWLKLFGLQQVLSNQLGRMGGNGQLFV